MSSLHIILTQNLEVVATDRLKVKRPWSIVASQQYSGRFFFFNTDTKECKWSLSKEIFSSIVDLSPLGSKYIVYTEPKSLEKTSEKNFSTLLWLQPTVVGAKSKSFLTQGRGGSKSLDVPRSRAAAAEAAEDEEEDGSKATAVSIDSFLKKSTADQPTSRLPSINPLNYLNSRKAARSNLLLSPTITADSGSVDKSEDIPTMHIGNNADPFMDIINEDRVYRMDTRNTDGATTPLPSFLVTDGLGCGGYAVVVKAKQPITKKTFAVKVIRKNFHTLKTKRERHRERINFELQIMSNTDLVAPSPFLQSCYQAYESPSLVFVLMDLNRGGDLFHHLAKRIEVGRCGFTETEAKILLAELYLALEHLHKYNIIHRDIKVENVMLDAVGHVKLVDFGLAVKLKTEVQDLGPAGSLLYMAPELITDKVGGRFTDWWAYGVLAHELLTGNAPWSSLHDKKQIKWEIMNKVVLPPSYLSQSASHLIGSLMCHSIKDRLGTKLDQQIKSCSFFKMIDWEAMSRLELAPAFLPSSSSSSSSPSSSNENHDMDKEDKTGKLENVSQSFQDQALDQYHRMLKADKDTQEKHPFEWSIGLPNVYNYLI